MLKRRRSFNALLPALHDAAQLRAVPAQIPADAELPTAAALAVAGIVLEVARWLFTH